MRQNQLITRLALIGLILITLSIYYPPYDWAFVGDDYVQFDYIKEVMGNAWAGLKLFNPYYLPWYYRPLQLAWFALLERIFHFLPHGFYWIELLFHVLAVSLVYRVGRQFRLGSFTAVFAAAIFAIHAHWVDVVSWLSSIAIVLAAVFSLLTLSAWLSYLKRPSAHLLLFTLLGCLLTFLSHEEAILLPPFLLLVVLAERSKVRKWRFLRKPGAGLFSAAAKKEIFLFAALGFITLAYLYIQYTRPNLTIDIANRETAEWLTHFSWPELAEFVLVTTFRFTYAARLLNLSGTAASLFVVAVLLLVAVWFWWGSRTIRLGLFWLALHLAFIYGALWTQLPNLFAGRHIYQGMIGLVLAIGATLDLVFRANFSGQNANVQRPQRLSRWGQAVVLVVVTAVFLHHINQIRQTQQVWLHDVVEEADARAQLATLFPTISPENHFFAIRFPIAPQFTRSVVQLWYDTPLERPGGSLDHLREVDRATRDFVVLDYADGQVYNLMPELQEHNETIFLWSRPAQQVWLDQAGGETAVASPDNSLPLVAAQNGSQLALKMTPENGRWLSHKIEIDLPPNSMLQTAVLPQPGLHYRLRLQTRSGETLILFDSAAGAAQNWQPIRAPLGLFSGQTVTLRFEILGKNLPADAAGYWANPRLVFN